MMVTLYLGMDALDIVGRNQGGHVAPLELPVVKHRGCLLL